jgi:hypothetical protein
MPQNATNPARGQAAGLRNMSCVTADGPNIAQNHEVAQARIELLREEIVATVSPLIATLEAALAMSAIPDDAGLIYALRSAQAYWQCAAASAAELVEIRGAP